MRWTWIDRFTSFESGKSAVAVKNLSLAEDHFADHFPGFPVMPAPLILEGLAQTGGILVGEANKFEKNVVLAKMTAKFHREAMRRRTTDLHRHTARPERHRRPRQRHGAQSGADLVAEAEIMFAHVTAAQLPPGLPDTKFVFSGELTHLLKMAEAAKASEPGVRGQEIRADS